MKFFFPLISIIALSITSCKDDRESVSEVVTEQSVVDNYVKIVEASYAKSIQGAEGLKVAVLAFDSKQTVTTYRNLKDSWLEARESYQPTEAFRFYGPIEEEVVDGLSYEVAINAWPLDESALDAIVAGTSNIDAASLIAAFSEDAETITIGWHPIEYLIWGTDKDTSVGGGGIKTLKDFTIRDRTYLKVATELLVDHLKEVAAEWKDGTKFRTEFTAEANLKKSLSFILTGIATLANAELAGERTADPFEDPGVNAEHSCFSDNTHRDNTLDWKGIAGVYTGNLAGVSGPSPKSYLALKAPTLATALDAIISDADAGITKMSATVFEELISKTGPKSDRPLVRKTMEYLAAFGDALVHLGSKSGLPTITNN